MLRQLSSMFACDWSSGQTLTHTFVFDDTSHVWSHPFAFIHQVGLLLWRDIVLRPFRFVYIVDITCEIARWCIHGQPEIPDLWGRVAIEPMLVWYSEEDVRWSQIAVYDGFPTAHRIILYCAPF